MTDPTLAGASAVALTGLAGAYRPRPVTPLMPWRFAHRLVKPYVITAPRRPWDDVMVVKVRDFTARQLDFDESQGGLGLAVVILHLGTDAAYVVIQTWAKDFQSRLSLFRGPDLDMLRPAPSGVGPCVWELEVLSHERAAYVSNILAGGVNVEAWLDDVLDTRPSPPLDGIPSGI
ncbi:hypothetical protein [Kribbella deserti]|uniref:Uncharacterized protein n=1 Tax=Kribbella deserti TaxID=1926257 RepID=A0ABV6QD49_9ACTN